MGTLTITANWPISKAKVCGRAKSWVNRDPAMVPILMVSKRVIPRRAFNPKMGMEVGHGTLCTLKTPVEVDLQRVGIPARRAEADQGRELALESDVEHGQRKIFSVDTASATFQGQ